MTIIIVVQKSDIDLAHDQSIIILTKFFRFFLFMCDSPNLSNLPPWKIHEKTQWNNVHNRLLLQD